MGFFASNPQDKEILIPPEIVALSQSQAPKRPRLFAHRESGNNKYGSIIEIQAFSTTPTPCAKLKHKQLSENIAIFLESNPEKTETTPKQPRQFTTHNNKIKQARDRDFLNYIHT